MSFTLSSSMGLERRVDTGSDWNLSMEECVLSTTPRASPVSPKTLCLARSPYFDGVCWFHHEAVPCYTGKVLPLVIELFFGWASWVDMVAFWIKWRIRRLYLLQGKKRDDMEWEWCLCSFSHRNSWIICMSTICYNSTFCSTDLALFLQCILSYLIVTCNNLITRYA